MKVGEDYEFADSIKSETTVPLKILTTPYKDVIFKFNTVKVNESSDKTHATVQFTYDIIGGPFTETTLRRDKKFDTHIGLILNSLILDAADMTMSQVKLKDSNGTNRKSDTTESFDE